MEAGQREGISEDLSVPETSRCIKRLIEIFTDPGDVVIDPCAGSGTTLRAAAEFGRSAYGFEISKEFYCRAKGKQGKRGKK